jgi:hypothetical protein
MTYRVFKLRTARPRRWQFKDVVRSSRGQKGALQNAMRRFGPGVYYAVSTRARRNPLPTIPTIPGRLGFQVPGLLSRTALR